ncbi:MAG: ribbon-helix-helix domain-containing protein [Proteobacteria bacterium]|nr:ribbon-helix-helix domain-containing protein [Pseudomonadota bacterium]
MIEIVSHSGTGTNNSTLPSPPTHVANALQSKNVRIHKRRTSVRLEPRMWNALNEIAALEGCSIHDLCGAVHDIKSQDASFTATLRVFMMEYYRSAAQANGQVSAQDKIRSYLARIP